MYACESSQEKNKASHRVKHLVIILSSIDRSLPPEALFFLLSELFFRKVNSKIMHLEFCLQRCLCSPD